MLARAHELVTPPTRTRRGTGRKEGSWECGEVTDGHRVGNQLDVGPGAGKKSSESSDLRDTRGPGVGSSDRERCPEGMGPKLPLPGSRPTAKFLQTLAFQA